MPIQWITLDRTMSSKHGADQSGLMIEDDVLIVTGVLPHGAAIRPTTARDRDALVNWLNGLDYGAPATVYKGATS